MEIGFWNKSDFHLTNSQFGFVFGQIFGRNMVGYKSDFLIYRSDFQLGSTAMGMGPIVWVMVLELVKKLDGAAQMCFLHPLPNPLIVTAPCYIAVTCEPKTCNFIII